MPYNDIDSISFNLNQLKGEKELFVVFFKDNDGVPTSIKNITPKLEKALSYFKDDSSINISDCIRLTSNNQSTVCDEVKWFKYGQDNKTKLATIKLDKSSKVVVNGVFATAVAPLAVASDILNVDPTLKKTRTHLTEAFTNPVQDFAELEKTKKQVLYVAKQQYDADKKQAMSNADKAVEFITNYPKDDFYEVVESIVNSSAQNKATQNIYKVLSAFPATPEQKNPGIEALRNMKTFDAFSKAFDLSGKAVDAKNAQKLASSQNDKRKVEYMAIKLLRAKNGTINKAFNVSITTNLDGANIKTKNGSTFFTFKSNIDQAVTNFSCGVKIKANKKLGAFQYGTYDVAIKAILKIPKHLMRRSSWLGNSDEDYVDEIVTTKTIRLSGPAFSADTTMLFDNVTATYKDRGVMGGTTEVTMTGDPSINTEVSNVTLVE